MQLSGKTILIIDDDPDFIRLVKRHLESLNFLVSTAQSEEQAYEVLSKELPHLICIDINLGKDCGLNIVKGLKANRKWRTIPSIILSADGDVKTIRKAIGLGVKAYEVKPLEMHHFLFKIRNLLKSQDLLVKSFERRPLECEVEVSAKLLDISEVEILIESPIRFQPESSFKMSSYFLGQMNWESIETKAIYISRLTSTSQFETKAYFEGIKEEQILQLRKGEK